MRNSLVRSCAAPAWPARHFASSGWPVEADARRCDRTSAGRRGL